MDNTINGKLSGTFEEIKIPVPWGHISGKWWGSRNQQPIIGVHGWQDNAGTFDNLAPLLVGRQYSLLSIDLPGHGLSSHLPPGQPYYVFWDGIQNLRRIINYFQWSSVTILGHSLGGCIAFLYAATFPDAVDKYISLDIASPVVRSCKTSVDALSKCIDQFLSYETMSAASMPCYNYEEILDLVEHGYKGSLTRDSCRIMMRRGIRPNDKQEGLFVFNRDVRLKVGTSGFFGIEQVLEFASRIRCAVLNIKGDPGMTFECKQHYNQVLDVIQAHARKLERHVVPGTHHLHLNNAQSVIEIIHNFLLS